MILPDVNLLVYSVDADSRFHEAARQWWDGVLSSTREVALTDPSALGFIRLTTHPRILAHPMPIAEALDRVHGWLAQPCVSLVVPGLRHWEILDRFLRSAGTGANLTTDAHLAALATEHGATLYSNDTDFARFEGLQWENPLA